MVTSNSRKENDRNDKELYQQKKQAQLDEWTAEVKELKAKASGASVDAQLELNKKIDAVHARDGQQQTCQTSGSQRLCMGGSQSRHG